MYPKTDAETSAGAAIVNSNYPPLNVDRYGTNTTPGTTRMAAAFQAAINVAKTAGGVVTWGRTAPYLIDAPLDCTCRPHVSIFGFTIRGEGQVSAISVNAPYYPGVIFKHDGVAGFDCTGNLGLLFEGGSYGTDRATFPKTGFLLARNSDKRSQVVRFRNVRTIGSGLQGNSAPSAAINIAGTLQNSANFNYNGIRTAIASSINNTLIGQAERLTVTARSNDYWIDTGTANKSFAPGIISGANNFSAVGAIAQRGKCLFSAGKVDFSIVLSAATSIAWTAGATIPTLPGVATDRFSCDVTDNTAGTLIGRGVISAGSGHSTLTLTVPQSATPHGITISGFYFVA